jgi:peptidoglycan/LPS O-acetylase OafA/YrhL
MVMAVHFCYSSWVEKWSIAHRIVGDGISYPELYLGTWFGWIGVQIFFVLSGFVIAYSAEGRTAFDFGKNRILRLYPAAWICATITAVTLLLLRLQTPSELLRPWLASITLFPERPWIDPVYWTLGIEMSFYAIIFLLLACRAFHLLERIAIGIGVMSSLFWILGALFADHFVREHFPSRLLGLVLVKHGCFFAIGAITYVISRRGLSPLRIVAMLTFVAAGLIQVGYTTASESQEIANRGLAIVPQFVLLLSILLIFVSIRCPSNRDSRFARWMRVVGLATYPLYLFHQIVGAAVMRIVALHGGTRWSALAIAVSLCVGGSLLIANLLEPPIRNRLRKWLDAVPRLSPNLMGA